MTTTLPTLVEARERLKVVQSALPIRVAAEDLHTRAKIPFKVLCCREGYFWRVEELARSACDSFEKGDVVAALLLARGVTETACALWFLMKLVERQIDEGVQEDLDQVVMRLLMGHKGQDEFPEAMNVLKFVDKANSRFEGLRAAYDEMSESAHPNFWGSTGPFSKPDQERKSVHFGRCVRQTTRFHVLVNTALVGSLAMTEAAYNSIADMMPALIERCERALNNDK